MSVDTFGARLPADLTLDDLATMAAGDGYGHRFEMSPEGVLSIMPPAGIEHAVVASRLFAWFLTHGWPADRVLQNCGLRTAVGDGVGGRVPDLTVWSDPLVSGPVWAPIDGLLLAVEIVSRGSEAIDRIIKMDEYAKAGVPRYWIVDRDAAQTVTMWQLISGDFVATLPAPQPMSWVLNSTPDQYLR